MSTPTTTAAPQGAGTVDELCGYIRRTAPGNHALLCDFARVLFAKVPRLVAERSPAELAALTAGAFDFLERARAGQVNVEVTNPEDEGWSAPVTMIRAEVGDRPFIVDSVHVFLDAEELDIANFVYPVFRVVRGADGRIVSVADGALEEDGPGTMEALVHCEITRVPSPERRAEIAAEVARRLADVVAATDDFRRMQDALDSVARSVEGYAARFPDRAAEYEEIADFLHWLRAGNFVFLGYREYAVGDAVSIVPGSGMGILGATSRSTFTRPVPLADLPEALRERATHGPLLLVSKANRESTVHRKARMDYVGVKTLDEAGNVVGERRFLGLFTTQAYGQAAGEIPILRRKQEELLAASGTRPGTHDYKEIVTILNTLPKDELFEAAVPELQAQVDAALGALFDDKVKVTVRSGPPTLFEHEDGPWGDQSVMVILPSGRFSAEVRQRVGERAAERLGGTLQSTRTSMWADDQAVLHYYVTAPAAGAADVRALEADVASLVRAWEDRLEEALAGRVSPEEAGDLARAYGPAMGADYRAAGVPAGAAADLLALRALDAAGEAVTLRLRQPVEGEPAPAGSSVLRLYKRDERLVLSDFMPILEDAGVRVIEVDTFELRAPGSPPRWIYSFAVQTREGEAIPDALAPILAEELLASHCGDVPKDKYNALVLKVGLRWREVDVLRTYANYASQAGAVPSREAPVRALMAYPRVARLLVDLFLARFDPERQAGAEALDGIRRALTAEMEKVASLVDDRVLRRMANIIEATVRTNYFRGGGADPTSRSGGVPYLSIKVRSADLEELRRSRLLYEVYVHSARMEGIHLRGAPVSRGGIRHSDRHDDFRTEVLGLVTTQVVKNAVIVPSGSKGGFITKRAYADRDQMGAEAKDQYRTLIRGLLDVTDNLVDGKVVPPPAVRRHDGDDPYLVVAADKGTAHLSNTANEVAGEYGFWLGDAFASGGSQGYDHKEEGITARGGWECVKRHFREMGKDIQKTPFTVAGVGDMSGDVFGNGMLLSRQIRLVAAFDHRHVFIDPDPDPETSFVERERMFALPRSSWDDYDRSRLSAGGMIVSRASKEIELTPEARAALGIPAGVERLDGEGLVRAVLTAPVELLWNGGIGTYVKDRDETHADVGDTANDPVRVNADELRCKVVGEGGNLGFTQRGRIAFAQRGGRINTDALDNSAGVDMSDHEVNLKILLNRVVTDGEMEVGERNALLKAMTDRVSELVLRNNIGQSLAVSLDEARSKESPDDFAALISALEHDRRIDRAADGFPDAEEMVENHRAGRAIARPSLCVLLAHAKLWAKQALLASTVPDDTVAYPYLVDYFPRAAVEAAGEGRLREHRLRREIVTTEVVNDLVNLMGAPFLHRLARDTGSDIPSVVRAWLVASRVAGAREIRADLEALEGRYPSETVYRWLAGLARVLEATTLWLLGNGAAEDGGAALVEGTRGGLATLRGSFARVVGGEDRALFLSRLGELQDLGVERTLGERLITLRFLPQLLEILRLSQAAGTEEMRAARAFYAVSERFTTAKLREGIRSVAPADPWEKRHAQALVDDVSRAQRAIAAEVLARAGASGDVDAALGALEAERAREARAYRELLAELQPPRDDAKGERKAGEGVALADRKPGEKAPGERKAKEVPLAAYALAVRSLHAIAVR